MTRNAFDLLFDCLCHGFEFRTGHNYLTLVFLIFFSHFRANRERVRWSRSTLIPFGSFPLLQASIRLPIVRVYATWPMERRVKLPLITNYKIIFPLGSSGKERIDAERKPEPQSYFTFVRLPKIKHKQTQSCLLSSVLCIVLSSAGLENWN
jgi:hypothetical protein